MTLRTLTAALLLAALPCLGAAAQEIRITGFSPSGPTAVSGDAPVRLDADGRPCALLRMETSRDGWTFDAGLCGIVDVARGRRFSISLNDSHLVYCGSSIPTGFLLTIDCHFPYIREKIQELMWERNRRALIRDIETIAKEAVARPYV